MALGSLAATVARISNGLYSVDLGDGQNTTRITYDNTKKIYQQPVPKTKTNWTQGAAAKQSDFLLITTAFNLEGKLVDDSSKTAHVKAYQLEQIFRAGGSFSFTWSNSPRGLGTTTHGVNVTGWRIVESQANTEFYDFTISLIEGTQR